MRSISMSLVIPALLTRMSRLPSFSAVSTRTWQPSAVATSACTATPEMLSASAQAASALDR
jgi:hypothetical protein